MRRFRAGTVTQAHGLNTRVSRRSFSLAHSNTYKSKSINAAIYKGLPRLDSRKQPICYVL
jgi:hypothetical protein